MVITWSGMFTFYSFTTMANSYSNLEEETEALSSQTESGGKGGEERELNV